MTTATRKVPQEQMSMPGMPAPYAPVYANSNNVMPGQEVVYLGDLTGGPPAGARGLLKERLGWRAVVDMGRTGVWHVPYYLLALPHSAN